MAGVLAIAFVALLWAGFLALFTLAMLANWMDKRKRKKLGTPESPHRSLSWWEGASDKNKLDHACFIIGVVSFGSLALMKHLSYF